MKKVIMKYKKSELDLFLQERIRENKEGNYSVKAVLCT